MAQFINDPVPKYKPEDLRKTTKSLHGYVVGLTDQLQYLLANLDADNVPELDAIKKRLTDTEGNITNLSLTAEGLALSIQNNEKGIASLVITVDGIQTTISNLDGDLSQLTQTAQGLESRVQDAENNITTVTQTAAGLQTRVGNAEGSISSLQQTATSLTSRVSNAENNISTVTQTAGRLESRVTNAEGRITSVTQTADGLESTVSNLNGKYTSLRQDVDSIDITGMVTFSDLEDSGSSVINGDNITTGDINIASNGVNGIYFYDGKTKSENEIGRIEVYAGRYPDLFIESVNDNDIRILSAAQVSVESGTDGHIYIEGDDYVQIRAGGVNWFFYPDGIYCGKTLVVGRP